MGMILLVAPHGDALKMHSQLHLPRGLHSRGQWLLCDVLGPEEVRSFRYLRNIVSDHPSSY